MYLLLISTNYFKAFLNAASKVVDITLTFLLHSGLSLHFNGCFQSSNAVRVIQVDVVLEEPASEKIWEIQIR